MGDGAWNEVELSTGRQNFEGGLGWVGPLAPAFQLFSWRVRLSLEIKIEESPLHIQAVMKISKIKLLLLRSWLVRE